MRVAARGWLSGRTRQFESFVDAAHEINTGKKVPTDFDHQLPTIGTTAGATAILEVPPPCLRCNGLEDIL